MSTAPASTLAVPYKEIDRQVTKQRCEDCAHCKVKPFARPGCWAVPPVEFFLVDLEVLWVRCDAGYWGDRKVKLSTLQNSGINRTAKVCADFESMADEEEGHP